MTRHKDKNPPQIHPKINDWRSLAAKHSDRFMRSKSFSKGQHTLFRVPNDETGALVDFEFRWAQQKAYDIYKEELNSNRPVRLWFLKSRRVGFTTLFAADDLVDVWARDNRRVGIVAHNDDRARRILAMCKSFYRRFPKELQLPLSKDATSGLKFQDHESELIIGTCKEPTKIRGDGLHRAHLSEAAYYGRYFPIVLAEIATTIAPAAGTSLIIETTGKARGSSCHRHWEASYNGDTQYRAVFFPWQDDPTAVLHFTTDRQKKDVMEEMQYVEPRLIEKNRYYKLSAEQAHWAYKQYVFRCELDYDRFCYEFPYDVEEAWASPGSSFFGDTEIARMATRVNEEPMYFTFAGRFINAIFKSFTELEEVKKVDENGSALYIKLWKGPIKGRPYVIGADCSMGDAGSSFTTGYVIDMATREMMCMYHGRIRPDEHAYVIASLGRIYGHSQGGEAMAAPEANPGGGGMEVLSNLHRLGYTNLYRWRYRDTIRGQDLTEKVSWWTTPSTRPTLLAEFRKIFQDCAHDRFQDPGLIKDKALLDEMRSFHTDPETGRPQAAETAEDDRIIAISICHRVSVDEVAGGALDIYLSYDKVDPSKALSDYLNKLEEPFNGADPADVVASLTNRGFDLDPEREGFVQWHE